MKPTHKIYLCNVNFTKRSSSSDESNLRKLSEFYSTIFDTRKQITNRRLYGLNRSDFIGVVDYLPVVKGGNIKDEANILVYVYKGKNILSHAYKSCISFICNFINENNITNIQLSGDDVERLNKNDVDIVSDIKNKVLHELNITVTKQRSVTNGYYLV